MECCGRALLVWCGVFTKICSTYAAHMTTPQQKINIMRKSGLASKVLVPTGVHLKDSWLPTIFDRFIACVLLDHDMDSRASLQVLKHLIHLAALNEELSYGEYGEFDGEHPNQFFITHGMRIGHEVVYQVDQMRGTAHPEGLYRCQTRIYGSVVTSGYGPTENASYTNNIAVMMRSRALRDYCLELKGIFETAFSNLHMVEHTFIAPADLEGYIAGFYSCTRSSVVKGLRHMELPPIEKINSYGLRIVVPRILTYYERHSIVLSLGVHKSVTASSELTFRRLCAALITGVSMMDIVEGDKILFTPSVLSVMGAYSPYVPYHPEAIRSYQGNPSRAALQPVLPPAVSKLDPPLHVDHDLTLSYIPEEMQGSKRPRPQ